MTTPEKTKRYKFIATIGTEKLYPKGFYYQGKHIIIVGCEKLGHTIRRKEKIEDVNIEVIDIFKQTEEFVNMTSAASKPFIIDEEPEEYRCSVNQNKCSSEIDYYWDGIKHFQE